MEGGGVGFFGGVQDKGVDLDLIKPMIVVSKMMYGEETRKGKVNKKQRQEKKKERGTTVESHLKATPGC